MRWPRTPTRKGSLAAILVLCLGGCTGSGGPEPVRAGGVVTYNGKPLSSAEVVFAPEGQGRVASATTDESGRFRLGTFRPGDGALAGKHRVAVIARGPAKRPPPGSPAALMPDDYATPGDPRIPKKYFSAATSGLTAVVDPNGDNEFEFALRD
jgi:hypothetical protein